MNLSDYKTVQYSPCMGTMLQGKTRELVGMTRHCITHFEYVESCLQTHTCRPMVKLTLSSKYSEIQHPAIIKQARCSWYVS